MSLSRSRPTVRRRHRALTVLIAVVAAVAAVGGVSAAVIAVSAAHGAPSRPGAGVHPRASGRSAPSIATPAYRAAVSQNDADINPPAPPRAQAAGTAPERVQIPAIGVDSTLQPLAVERSGALQAPSQWQRAGWYAAGVRPGDTGPAVIAGHVDSTAGPAVFFRLRFLRVGSTVYVTRADGARLTFTVDGSVDYPKRSFPSQAVYGPTTQQVLRLITCTGDFDRRTGSYLDNLVVSTHLVTGSPTGGEA